VFRGKVWVAPLVLKQHKKHTPSMAGQKEKEKPTEAVAPTLLLAEASDSPPKPPSNRQRRSKQRLLEHLEKNRFETSNLYKKKLLLFNDVERYGGSVSVLKALTGGDLIRNEQKFQTDAQKPFKFGGLVMITANEPIQTTDPTSGLARRRLTIPFNNPLRALLLNSTSLLIWMGKVMHTVSLLLCYQGWSIGCWICLMLR